MRRRACMRVLLPSHFLRMPYMSSLPLRSPRQRCPHANSQSQRWHAATLHSTTNSARQSTIVARHLILRSCLSSRSFPSALRPCFCCWRPSAHSSCLAATKSSTSLTSTIPKLWASLAQSLFALVLIGSSDCHHGPRLRTHCKRCIMVARDAIPQDAC
jgi:hypothetical protein